LGIPLSPKGIPLQEFCPRNLRLNGLIPQLRCPTDFAIEAFATRCCPVDPLEEAGRPEIIFSWEEKKKNAYLFCPVKLTTMRKMTKVNLNHEKLEVSSALLRALAHPLRLQILEFIDQNDAINVNKIYSSLKLEQSITSQHLRVLRMADLVKTERDGKYIHYRIDYEKLDQTMQAIRAFLKEKPAGKA
jgi:DNA-binding transcriptional ArsR family regulator